METGAERVLWNLGDIYTSQEKLKEDAENLLEKSREFHQRYSNTEKIFQDSNSAKASIEALSQLYDDFGKMSEYVQLKFAENTISDEVKKLMAWFENVETEFQSNLIFFSIAISKMSDDTFKAVIPSLEKYRHFVESSRRFKDHIFSEKEEQLIVYKNTTGPDAFVKFYTQLVSTYKFKVEMNGKMQTLNGSQLRSLRMHSDPKVREMASSRLFKRYKKDALEIESAYNAIVKDYDNEAFLRGYPTPNSMRNLDNEVNDLVVDTLGQIKDVMTLGHELGHGLHAVLSSKQNILQYHTPLTMAETSSTFAEMLLMDYFLDTLPKKEVIPFIASKLEDLFATMNRQNMFTRFERRAHEKISKDGATFDELSDIYNEELHTMFGDAVEYNPEFILEWSSVPHFFHTPFYCYAYDFAQLLVISLYAKYKEGMPNFKKRYIDLLSAGGSDNPERLLEPFGIKLSDPKFWQSGFNYIEENLVKRLESDVK